MTAARLGALIVLGAVVASALGQDQGPPPANVVLDTARIENIAQQREVIGNIRSRYRASLAAQVEGIVIELPFEPGDAVEAGQVVARLDDTIARLEVERQQAEVAAAGALVEQRKAELEDAQRDQDRLAQLDARGSASVAELEKASIRVQTERARLAAAEASELVERSELALAQERLADTAITAPFAGRVVVKNTEIGQWVDRGDAVVTVLSVTELQAWIDVPESVVGLLREGEDQLVPVRITALDRWVDATLTRIVPEADELSRLYPVRLRVPNDDGAIKPGMSLTALVPTSRIEPTLTVHKDAVLRSDIGEYVYFDSSGVARVAPIQRLFAVGNRIAVRSAVLTAGMRTVVQGNERMFPSQQLSVLRVLGEGEPAEGVVAGDGPEDPEGGG